MIEALPARKSLSGHDAYCHVCWEPFYALWVDRETPPPNDRCVLGAKVAHECPQAMASAELSAFLRSGGFSTEPNSKTSPGKAG